jgi:hypothetical protein
MALLSLGFFSLATGSAAGLEDNVAELVARGFFHALLEGQPGSALPLCADEVNFDGLKLRGPDALRKQLAAMSARARSLGLRLTRVVLMAAPEAVKRFGPPPARLARAVGPGSMIALARLSTGGAVAVLRKQGGFWRVTALTD